jgi:hypothetical protein
MELLEYAEAGYNKRFSEQPPYPTSPIFMAFQSGVWCREHGINVKEIRSGRGYKMIVNRTYALDWKKNDYQPDVTRIN